MDFHCVESFNKVTPQLLLEKQFLYIGDSKSTIVPFDLSEKSLGFSHLQVKTATKRVILVEMEQSPATRCIDNTHSETLSSFAFASHLDRAMSINLGMGATLKLASVGVRLGYEGLVSNQRRVLCEVFGGKTLQVMRNSKTVVTEVDARMLAIRKSWGRKKITHSEWKRAVITTTTDNLFTCVSDPIHLSCSLELVLENALESI